MPPMLDVQKERVLSNRSEVQFARKVVVTLAATGWIAPALLMFHGMFFWGILLILWFLLAVSLMPSFKGGQDWARVTLGSLCVIGAALGGLAASHGNTLFMPGADPLLEHESLPKWSCVWCAGIMVIGVTLLASRRVRKATTLWSTFK